MSSMMSGGGAPPDPQAAAAASSGNYPTSSDPAMSALADAAEDIQKFIAAEPDPQKKAEGAKLLAQCHSIISGGEKQHDAALGLSPALKFIQRQQAAQSGGGSASASQPAPSPQGLGGAGY